MSTLTDRFAAGILRSAAIAMLFAGISMLVAGVPLSSVLAGSAMTREISGILLQISGVFVIAGAASLYLSSPRAVRLPNEHMATSDAERPEVAGWLIALAVALVALPAFLALRLRPFLAEWRRVVDVLARFDLWEGANANMSGVVLVPLAAALTPPLFELAAMVAFVVASVALLALLFGRSERFPRLYLVSVLLLSALVIASVRGASAARLAAAAVQPLIEGSNALAGEAAQVTDVLGRYTRAVSLAAPALVWTLCGYLIWVPAMVWSRRARATFATSVGGRVSTPATAADIESITTPPRFPG